MGSFFIILFFLFFLLRKYNLGPIFLSLIFLGGGIFYYQWRAEEVDQNHIAFFANQEVVFQGRIERARDSTVRGEEVVLGEIKMMGEEKQGRVLLNLPLYSDFQYQDLVEVNCFLQGLSSTEDSYARYLKGKRIFSFCFWPKVELKSRPSSPNFYGRILAIRKKAQHFILTKFSEPQASFLGAILLGVKKRVSSKIRNWFSLTGASHLLAVSGLHIAILVQMIGFFLINFLRIKRTKVWLPISLIVLFFILLTGAAPATIRAGLMGLSLFWAQKNERGYNSLNFLFLIGVIMLLFNPNFLVFNIGFQLSFLAVLGIGLFYNFFQELFRKIPDYRFLAGRTFLSLTCSAQILILPLVLYYFGTFSLIAPLVNVFLLLVMPSLMLLGFLFLIGNFLNFYLGQLFFYPLWLLATYVILIVKVSAKIPYSSFIISSFSRMGVFLSYLFLFLFYFYLRSFSFFEK
ncbi:ComEC/Rec2 family competence protein [Patescibacteria group bacterium]|nr:ComEC/Rec2 family competence protein [Patescibacteria group bacterium]